MNKIFVPMMVAVGMLASCATPTVAVTPVTPEAPETMAAEAVRSDEAAIRGVLADQLVAWNAGDVDGFLKDYWRSDALRFVSDGKMTLGWPAVQERFRETYSDKDAMGTLAYEILELEFYSAEDARSFATWSVDDGAYSGFFTLTYRKIDGRWQIVTDHS